MRVGDWVEVRSEAEILATLDEKSQLDGMPFMPEMLQHCGRRYQIHKVAHKACDTVFPVRARRIARAVHLNTRCDGGHHGGCEAGCLLYWKEQWLKPGAGDASQTMSLLGRRQDAPRLIGKNAIWLRAERVNADGEKHYVCQATQLPYASTALAWWDCRQYVEDFRSGNVSLARIAAGLSFAIYYKFSQMGVGLGKPLRWLYGAVLRRPWPWSRGALPEGAKTPEFTLNLQPGELVRVRPLTEILQTITVDRKNRGMSWDAEMTPHCGHTYRVLRRVTRIIDERSGRLLTMKTPSIILDTVVCEARYSGCRVFCPRSIYPYWREIWLERVAGPGGAGREA